MEDLIFLDTHVVVWLYTGDPELFSPQVRQDLEESELFISPVVSLEIQYLHEIERISVGARKVTENLQRTIGLQISDTPFKQVVSEALLNTWTRDPFDRIITAQASLGEHRLLTRDQTIRDHYKRAYWT